MKITKTALSAGKAAGKAAINFINKPFVSKTLGAAAGAAIIYNMHINGRESALSADRKDSADRYIKNYQMYSAMSTKSPAQAEAKNMWFEMHMSASWRHVISKVCGYVSGAARTFAGSLPEAVLAACALSRKKHDALGKIAGWLLAADYAKTFLYDIAGIGKTKKELH